MDGSISLSLHIYDGAQPGIPYFTDSVFYVHSAILNINYIITVVIDVFEVLNKRPLGLTAPLSNCLCYTNDV